MQVARLSQSFCTTTPNNFYHSNQMRIVYIVESFNSWSIVCLSISSSRRTGLTSLVRYKTTRKLPKSTVTYTNLLYSLTLNDYVINFWQWVFRVEQNGILRKKSSLKRRQSQQSIHQSTCSKSKVELFCSWGYHLTNIDRSNTSFWYCLKGI